MRVKIDRIQFGTHSMGAKLYRIYVSATVGKKKRSLHFDLDAEDAQAVIKREMDDWLKEQFQAHKFIDA